MEKVRPAEGLTIFIGSGEASRIEEKTLIHSLRKHAGKSLDIRVFNGTANTIEIEDSAGKRSSTPAPLSAALKRHNMTEYSLYRFLVPEACGYRGRAVYLDADIVCLADIRELASLPAGDWEILAARPRGKTAGWALGVMLFECARSRFDLDRIFREIDDGLFTYRDLLWTTPLFLRHHPAALEPLSPLWHARDEVSPQTKLVHYTFIPTQPWRAQGHPHGRTWFDYFEEARRSGYISDADLESAVAKGHVRPDITQGNSPSILSPLRHRLIKWWRRWSP